MQLVRPSTDIFRRLTPIPRFGCGYDQCRNDQVHHASPLTIGCMQPLGRLGGRYGIQRMVTSTGSFTAMILALTNEFNTKFVQNCGYGQKINQVISTCTTRVHAQLVLEHNATKATFRSRFFYHNCDLAD